MNKDKLLAVLDMSEDEQYRWVSRSTQQKNFGYTICPNWDTLPYQRMVLADLAFRLRDEVKYIHRCSFVRAAQLVYCHCLNVEKVPKDDTLWRWFSREANPIHIIIAALIAKESNE